MAALHWLLVLQARLVSTWSTGYHIELIRSVPISCMNFHLIRYRSSQCSCLQPGANWRHSARCSKSIYRCSCHSGGKFSKLLVCRQSCQKNAPSRIYVFLIGSPSPHGDWCLHPRIWFLSTSELMLECRAVVAINVISTVRT